MTSGRVERVVLVGFMGAGKSAVGRMLADQMGWTFTDADEEIERRAGRSLAELFAEGEVVFRAIEEEVTAELLRADRVIVATGGGWAARPGWPSEVPERSLTVWLDVSTKEALRRAGPDFSDRPLLATPLGREAAAARHEKRRASYALAKVRVDTEGSTVDDVSARILEILAAD